MIDLRRQLATARRDLNQTTIELRETQQRLKSAQKMVGEVPTEYADAMHLLREVAYGGWRRPDDLGATITTNGSESRAPAYSEAAYNTLRTERRWLAKELLERANHIENKIARWVDGETRKEQTSGTP